MFSFHMYGPDKVDKGYPKVVLSPSQWCMAMYRVRKWKVTMSATYEPFEGSPEPVSAEFEMQIYQTFDLVGELVDPMEDVRETMWFDEAIKDIFAEGEGTRHFEDTGIETTTQLMLSRGCYTYDTTGNTFGLYVAGAPEFLSFPADYEDFVDSSGGVFTSGEVGTLKMGGTELSFDAVWMPPGADYGGYTSPEILIEAIKYWDHSPFFGTALFDTDTGEELVSPFA